MEALSNSRPACAGQWQRHDVQPGTLCCVVPFLGVITMNSKSLDQAPGTTWQALLLPGAFCQLHSKAYPNLACLYMNILIQKAAK